jgi:hypothetical protein
MELLTVLIGAIIGAVFSFALSEYTKRKDERKKLLTALRTEVSLNLEVAQEILNTNSLINFDTKDEKQWGWCEVVPFSEAAWIAVTSTGALSHFDQKLIEPLLRVFAMVKKANFAAEKMKAGRYDPREGKEYTLRVHKAKEELEAALKVLGGMK